MYFPSLLAIARDERDWPERFAEEDVSVLGSDLRLAPFGSPVVGSAASGLRVGAIAVG